MVDVSRGQGAQRHVGGRCIGRILDHGYTAAALEIRHARRPVVEFAAQHDRDGAAPITSADGAEQGIDRGARKVFPRPAAELDGAVDHQKMEIFGRNIDDVIADRLVMFSGSDGHVPGGRKRLGKQVLAIRADMKRDENRCAQMRRQILQQNASGSKSARGAADCDGSLGVERHFGGPFYVAASATITTSAMARHATSAR